MNISISRRELLLSAVAAPALGRVGHAQTSSSVVERHDQNLEKTLQRQNTDPQSRWCGGVPDSWELYHCGSAGGLLHAGAAAYFHPESKLYKNPRLFERMKLAAGFLERMQTDQGNIDLLTTNFNSPPDTGFVVHRVASAAKLAAMNNDNNVLKLMETFLRRAGSGLAQGGIHTPNHRWVVSAALAQINDVFPDKRYVQRIDQWLAEGIDIDEEGMFIERSTTVYNTVCDYSFVVLAHKLNRPELLEPVRKNLDAMLYLVHPNFEVVTEISRRQDLNRRAGMDGYWFPLRYMAIHDDNGQYTTILKSLEPERINLGFMMEYPELQKTLPQPKSIPDKYKKEYPLSEITRIRNGKNSATIMHRNNNRWMAVRHGDAVINAIRFASAFFGKGQFMPDQFEIKQGVYYFKQEFRGPYYQPIADEKLLPIDRDKWGKSRSYRDQSEICEMVYDCSIKETTECFEIEISASGTNNVPLAIEINLRDGGVLENVDPAPNVNDAYLLKDGFAEYRMGKDRISFGPGCYEHAYTQIRGAEAKLSGSSVYLTGFTPFKHTLNIRIG